MGTAAKWIVGALFVVLDLAALWFLVLSVGAGVAMGGGTASSDARFFGFVVFGLGALGILVRALPVGLKWFGKKWLIPPVLLVLFEMIYLFVLALVDSAT